MVYVGFTVSSPTVSVCIRYSWILGIVKDKCLKYKSTEDQYVDLFNEGHDQIKNIYLYLQPNFIPKLWLVCCREIPFEGLIPKVDKIPGQKSNKY